jgi:hypothetical protein
VRRFFLLVYFDEVVLEDQLRFCSVFDEVGIENLKEKVVDVKGGILINIHHFYIDTERSF